MMYIMSNNSDIFAKVVWILRYCMDDKLMGYSTEKLLNKYGAGSHKPGSGSAAAHFGLISANLLLTVIQLTGTGSRRVKYLSVLSELEEIAKDIRDNICPELEFLFQQDSDQFGKTIDARRARDQENDPLKRRDLAEAALEELKKSTLIPMKIADLCLKLANYGSRVFDLGFKGARGDTSVALNGAVAAVDGSLSIIFLNLNSFGLPHLSWMREILLAAVEIKNSLDSFAGNAVDCTSSLKNAFERKQACLQDFDLYFNAIPREGYRNEDDIENVARELQLLLWKHKETIWGHDMQKDPLGILDPVKALLELGYSCSKSRYLDSIEDNGESVEVAGVIDRQRRTVIISRNYDEKVQRFTAAHELGHALLHEQQVLHRDRPLDGSTLNRSIVELEADKFAAAFLMPAKQVQKVFNEIYGVERFRALENDVFNRFQMRLTEFRKAYKTTRHIARYFAVPLADIFGVSLEAMAIRLEELGLIEN